MKGLKEELYVYCLRDGLNAKMFFVFAAGSTVFFFPFEPILQLGVFRRMNFVCGFYSMTCFAFMAVHATFISIIVKTTMYVQNPKHSDSTMDGMIALRFFQNFVVRYMLKQIVTTYTHKRKKICLTRRKRSRARDNINNLVKKPG